MPTLGRPTISDCNVAGCSYNHDGCHAYAITVGGSRASAECGTFIGLSAKGGLDTVKAQVGGCRRTDCAHNVELACTAPAIRVGAGTDLADCLTYAER